MVYDFSLDTDNNLNRIKLNNSYFSQRTERKCYVLFKAACYFPMTPSDSLTSTHTSIGRSFSRKKKQVFFWGGGWQRPQTSKNWAKTVKRPPNFWNPGGKCPPAGYLCLSPLEVLTIYFISISKICETTSMCSWGQ